MQWVHILPRQVVPAAHLAPQPPQLVGSVAVVAHEPLQFVWPELQQIPVKQFWPAAQARPHVPQLLGSLEKLTHFPLHATVGEVHMRQPVPLQKPLAQVLVVAAAQLPAPSHFCGFDTMPPLQEGVVFPHAVDELALLVKRHC